MKKPEFQSIFSEF